MSPLPSPPAGARALRFDPQDHSEQVDFENLCISLQRCPETDSGLDIDALRVVAEGINSITPTAGCLLITHYQRLLDHVEPDYVHVMIDGKIVKTGGSELAAELESKGYDWLEA